MALTVPDLRDDAVVLRPPARGDADAITLAVQDPAIPRYTLVPSPYRRDDADAWIERSAGLWQAGTDAAFVVVDGDDQLLGSVGVHRIDRDAGRAEVGYWVAVWARGRGVARRALRLATRWALDDLGLERVEALIFPDNERSARVAAAAGFRREGLARARVEHARGRRDALVYVATRARAPAGRGGGPGVRTRS